MIGRQRNDLLRRQGSKLACAGGADLVTDQTDRNLTCPERLQLRTGERKYLRCSQRRHLRA